MDSREILKVVYEEIAKDYGEGEEWRRTIDGEYWQSYRVKRLRNDIGTIGLIETEEAISFVVWGHTPEIEEGEEYMSESFRIKARFAGDWRASKDTIRAHFGPMGISVYNPIAGITSRALAKAEMLAKVAEG